jgi:hypothetical protein
VSPYEHGNHVHVCAYTATVYSTVGVIEQKDMVNSGVRGVKGRNLRSRWSGILL